MNKLLFTGYLLLFSAITFAQVGINNTDPKASLDITASNVSTPSNTDGILIPRIDDFPSTNPGADQDGMMVYATGNGTPTKGFYYWDNGTTSWTSVVGSKNTLDQAYDEGGAGAGRTIIADTGAVNIQGNDGLTVNGNVSIGSTSNATYPLYIDSNLSSESTAQYINYNGSGSGVLRAIYNNLGTTITGSIYGVENYFNSNSSSFEMGFRNNFISSGNSSLYGFANYFLPIGSPNTTTGLYNRFQSLTSTSLYGTHNQMAGAYTINANVRGLYNDIQSSGSGDRYGVYTYISNSGTGTKYGTYNSINSSSGGTHYGIYNDVQNSSGYAAYFIGRTSLGDGTVNRYLMPSSDGTTNQVISTNGSGQLSFVDASSVFTDTDTDDQSIDVLNLSGNTLEISLQDDGVATQTLDLSPLASSNTLDEAYDEGGAGAGKNITADTGAVRINGDDGFLVTGTLGSGNTINTEITGIGTRMFFNPNKAAFRAGYVSTNQWDDTNIGNYSTAFGAGSIASGETSSAFGSFTTASAQSSTAFGAGTTASGIRSSAFGSSTVASGANATAFNNSTNATGDNSIAFGNTNTASGNNSTVFGNNNTAPSAFETVIGLNSTTYTPNSTSAFDDADRLFVIGNGINSISRSNALTIYKNGSININDAYTLPATDGSANQVMTTDGSGTVSWTDSPANFSLMRATLSSNQALGTGGWQKLNFDTTTFDLNSEFNTTTDRFVAASAGYYRIKAQYHTSTTQGNEQEYGIGIRVSGSLVQEFTTNHYDNGVTDGLVIRQISMITYLNASDYVEIGVKNYQSGVSLDSWSGKTNFEVERIR